MPGRSVFEEDKRLGTDDRRAPKLSEQIKNYLLVFSLLSLVFTFGYNWRRVDELAVSVKAVDRETLDATYVRRDVLAQQVEVFNQQMAALRLQIDDLKATVRESHR